MSRILTITIGALMLAAPALAQNEVAAPPPSSGEKPVAPDVGATQDPPAGAVQDSPSDTLAAVAAQLGKGPPDNVVCLPAQPKTSTHIAVPRICLKNWEWANFIAGKVCLSKDYERIMSCWMQPPPYRYSNWRGYSKLYSKDAMPGSGPPSDGR